MTLRHDGGFFACQMTLGKNSPRYTEEFLQLSHAHQCLLQQWASLDGTAAPIESLLMGLGMDLSPACVPMHIMGS